MLQACFDYLPQSIKIVLANNRRHVSLIPTGRTAGHLSRATSLPSMNAW
jgi:hypothetical protein